MKHPDEYFNLKKLKKIMIFWQSRQPLLLFLSKELQRLKISVISRQSRQLFQQQKIDGPYFDSDN